MTGKFGKREKELYERIKVILWKDWDPIGVNDGVTERDDEYDGYAPSVFQLVIENKDVFKISNHLYELERVSMGINSSKTSSRNKDVAEKIIKAKREIFEPKKFT
jgi:hypothetical protein